MKGLLQKTFSVLKLQCREMEQNVEWMLQAGVDVFIEVGPGKTLTQNGETKLPKLKGASVQLFHTDNLKAVTETIEKVKELKG